MSMAGRELATSKDEFNPLRVRLAKWRVKLALMWGTTFAQRPAWNRT
jgi:hypothetical protein